MSKSLTIETIAEIYMKCYPECMGVTITNVYADGFEIHLHNVPMDSVGVGLKARMLGMKMFSSGTRGKNDSVYTLLCRDIFL